VAKRLTSAQLLAGLKAAGEATRLRLLALLAEGELNVKDLTRILGQSQPRISRHLKLLAEAGLVERFREGSWVYFRLADASPGAGLARRIVSELDPDDPVLERDRAQAGQVKREREAAAQAYFKAHAAQWDRIRSLHLAEEQVEAAMLEALGPGPFDLLVDLGTGTGRVLELVSQRVRRGVGIDINRDMLAYARARLEHGNRGNCQVRQGDLYNLALEDGCADAVVLHQVLHYLDNPERALREAGRILKPGGRLVAVDFAPHELDFLRDEHAHRRLGIDAAQFSQWLGSAGLRLSRHTELEPEPGGEERKLTVSLWLARKPGVRRAEHRAASDSLRAERVT